MPRSLGTQLTAQATKLAKNTKIGHPVQLWASCVGGPPALNVDFVPFVAESRRLCYPCVETHLSCLSAGGGGSSL